MFYRQLFQSVGLLGSSFWLVNTLLMLVKKKEWRWWVQFLIRSVQINSMNFLWKMWMETCIEYLEAEFKASNGSPACHAGWGPQWVWHNRVHEQQGECSGMCLKSWWCAHGILGKTQAQKLEGESTWRKERSSQSAAISTGGWQCHIDSPGEKFQSGSYPKDQTHLRAPVNVMIKAVLFLHLAVQILMKILLKLFL